MNALFEDRDGTLWAGFFGKGLAQFRAGRFHHLSDSGRIPAITQSADGALWVASDGEGLERIFQGKHQRFTRADGLPSDHVMCLYADPNNDVWAGTASGGLSRIRNGQVVSWTMDNGMPESTVGSITEDGLGNLWFGGDNGIYRASKAEINRAAESTSRTIHWVAYGTADGLRSRETLYGSMPSTWKDRQGRLWFATIMGAAMIDPAHAGPGPILSQVSIQRITFDSRPVPFRDGIALGPGAGNLTISFTTPTFVSPKLVRFRYKLQGFDKDWIWAGSRHEAWYTNLPGGNYRLLVQAANSDGVWNAASSSVSFVLRPPWTRTPLAYACYGIAVVMLAWMVVLLRTRRLVHRERELKRLVAERTAQLQIEKQELMGARKQLQFRALHDALTGLWNRGAIMEALAHEVERAMREESVLTIVLGDLDHFKLINDMRGHICGDSVLEETARRLSASLRGYDAVGRYGGEEFLILLPGCNAAKSPERIRALADSLRSQPFVFQGQAFDVTCSFGAVVYEPAVRPTTIEHLLSRADKALYRAKNAGRDRIEIEAPPVSVAMEQTSLKKILSGSEIA